MKTFRVHLKDGKTFAVTAHHFDFNPNSKKLTFYKDEKTEDTDILIFASDVVAIVPDAGMNMPTSSSVVTR